MALNFITSTQYNDGLDLAIENKERLGFTQRELEDMDVEELCRQLESINYAWDADEWEWVELDSVD